MEIWPNPANGVIHGRFYMDDGRFNKDLTLVIYDIFGRIAPTPALPHPGEGAAWTVDVSTLPAGIYLAVVKEGLVVRASSKFIVAR